VVLVVPSSTYRAADFLEAASRLGVEVVVASEEPQPLAGVKGGRALLVDLDDPEGAARAIVGHDAAFAVDAVVAVDDRGTEVAGAASRLLGLRHNPAHALQAARDKLAMRHRLSRHEVPQPAFAELPSSASDDEVVRIATSVGFPCVVKPTTLSASQGVLRADGPGDVAVVANRVHAIARGAGVDDRAPLLVEHFVAGPEVAVEGLLSGGHLEVLAVFDKPDPLEGPAFEETIYVTPSRLPSADVEAASHAVAAATAALGLVEGPVHGEVRVSGGRATVIEVAARTIGGRCGRALAFGHGRSLEELVLAQALGLPADDRASLAGASGVLMIPIPSAGRLVGVDGKEAARAVPGIVDVEITVAPGRFIAPPPEGNRYLGFVFARAPEPAEVEGALRAARHVLTVRLEPASDDDTTRHPPATCP
jgi:biotin carboxylase